MRENTVKPTIWIFSLEPLESRYTRQWHDHIPSLLKDALGNRFNINQVDGVQKNTRPTPGAFLNFSDTNYWKSSQLCNFLERYNQGETSLNDHFLFTDAWNPTVIQLKYMGDLLGFNWTFHGMWHAGSYDQHDFLGRMISNTPWVRDAERSFFNAFDYNYFASKFHIDMFSDTFLDPLGKFLHTSTNKIVQSGWPMEYMEKTLCVYKQTPKQNIILFPHRLAPEKQVNIFLDLKKQLPQYEFVVCQEKQLTKNEYHSLLGKSKLVFSANLQETLGISWYEGVIVNSIPMVPDRLSYSEMALSEFKYPSVWTETFETYQSNRHLVVEKIIDYMENYEQFLPSLNEQADFLTENYFRCNNLLKMLQ